MTTSNADAQGASIIAKAPWPLRMDGPSFPPSDNSTRPSLNDHGPPTARRSSPPAPRAREARRALARGGLVPRCQAGPPLKRSSALPSVRNSADTGGRGAKAFPATKTRAAPANSAKRARGRAQKVRPASRRSQAAIDAPLQGLGSTAAQGRAEARTQVHSKSHSPAPASFAAAGAAKGSQASVAHSRTPPASNGPDSGTRMTLTKGPTSDARPKTASQSGQSAAAMARLTRNRAEAARSSRGQPSGEDRSAPSPAQMIAAHAPTLMTALGDSAAAGSRSRRAAAAKVREADAVVSRPRARPASAAASVTQARTHGGSAPAIKV